MIDNTKDLINAYDNNAHSFEERFMDIHLYKDSFNTFLDKVKDHQRILELGSGPGNVASYLLQKNNTLKIHGIDFSSEMVKLAQKNAPAASFEVRDIRNVDSFYNLEYDHIIAAFCLPFLYDDEAKKLIHDVGNILQSKGTFYLSTMMGQGYAYEVPSFSKGETFFFNYYSEEFIKAALNANNFEIQTCILQDYQNNDGSILKDMIFIAKKK